jgi:hypothetical protein
MTILDKEKYQIIREKTGAQHRVKEIQQYQKNSLQHVQRWTQTEYQNKHYNREQKNEETQEDSERDGGKYFILRIKEQETRLNVHEHDDDNNDDD